MALLRDAYHRARTEGSGHERLFGNAELARLSSAIQGAIISSGLELERLILERAHTINDLDAYLNADIIPEGVFAVPKRQIKQSKVLDVPATEPDFLLFERKGRHQNCYIIELKDGDQFDTKKAAGERASLHKFMTAIAQHIQFRTTIHVCFFHAANRQQVVDGFKRKISVEEALTGTEFCDILGIDYDDIIMLRREKQIDNFNFFIDRILEIEAVQESINDKLGFGRIEW